MHSAAAVCRHAVSVSPSVCHIHVVWWSE